MTDHTWGVDKSHYDSAGGTGEIVKEGFGFLTHKAGGDANDPQLNAFWNDAKPHRFTHVAIDQDGDEYLAAADGSPGLLLGAYWVLYPGHGSGAGDSFLARLDSQCPGWRDAPFILQLDCEEWNGDTGTMPKLADIRACANRLRVLAPKLQPIVYAPHWAYGDSLTGLGYPLWSSSYTTKKGAASAIYPGDGYAGWAKYSGVVPTIAQFSSTATVAGDSTTDVNCFKGTGPALARLLAPGFQEVSPTVAFDLTTKTGNQAHAGRTVANFFNDLWGIRDYLVGDVNGTKVSAVTATSPLALVVSAARAFPDLVKAVANLTADVALIKSQTGQPAQVDVVALAAALDPLVADVTITPEIVEQAFILMAGQAAGPKPVADEWDPARNTVGVNDGETPIHDEAADALTKRLRQDRQPGIQGS
jgi:hypothetical protein